MANVNNYPPSIPPSTSTQETEPTPQQILEETLGIDMPEGSLDMNEPADTSLQPQDSSFGDTESALTQDKIRELYKGVQKKVQSGEAEADDLDKLMRALSAFNQGNEARAQELVNEATGGEVGAAGESSDVAQAFAEAGLDYDAEASGEGAEEGVAHTEPSSIESDGTKVFISSDPEFPITLNGSGDDSKSRVETEGPFIFTPKSPEDEVKVSKSGNTYIIRSKNEGKTETIRVKASSIEIATEEIKGNFNNEDAVVTVNGETYVSKQQLDKITKPLDEAADELKSFSTDEAFLKAVNYQSTTGVASGLLTSITLAERKQMVASVKEVVRKLAEFNKESDPEKKDNIKNDMIDIVDSWSTQGVPTGDFNIAGERGGGLLLLTLHSVFEKIYPNDNGLRKAFQNGNIPSEIGSKLADIFETTIKDDEPNLNKQWPAILGVQVHYPEGETLNWTYATAASTLRRYAGGADISEE